MTDAYVATLTCPPDKARFCVTDAAGGLMVTVEQNGNKRWRWRRGSQMSLITIGDPDRLSYQAALEVCARLERAWRDGTDPRSVVLFPERNVTVGDVLDHHIAKVKTPTNAETIRTMTSAYKPLRASFGLMPAVDFERKHLIAFLEDDYENRQGAARSLVRCLTAAFTMACAGTHRLLPTLPHGNPAKGILAEVKFQRKTKPASYAKSLEGEEIRDILSAIEALKIEGRHEWLGLTIIELVLLTGARPSEIQSLRWDEFSKEKGMTVITKRRHKRSHATDKPRQIILSEVADGVIGRVREHHHSKSLAGEWLFPRSAQYKKARADHITTAYHFAKLVSERSRVDFTVYNLRSIYINHSIAVLGHSFLKCIAENVGHESTATTQKHYMATKMSDKLFSIAKTGEAFGDLSSSNQNKSCL
ncbi:MAG: tyrosine-type recombinase/integrase [Caulobacteraceae bacterium]|nr:tyrosine-type recombinase/integrase [Caulobacteraceae bacterium]